MNVKIFSTVGTPNTKGSLMLNNDEGIASFSTGDLYDHHDAEGFITLYGLSTKVRAMKLNNKKG